MADISVDLWTWSSTASSNNPSGSTAVGTGLDDNLRALGAAMKAASEPLSSLAGTNTITGTCTGLTAYASGQHFRFIPANSNTGASTLNVTSLGAKNIFLNGVALVGYEIRKNCPVEVLYDGTQFNIIAGAHGGDGVPIATVKDRAISTVPNGYLECDGSAVSRTTYPDLFAVLSTTWGVGDGSTTFNVPDFKGRARIGKGTGTVAESVTDANVSAVNDTFTVTSNNTKWITGQAVILTTTTTLPTGLSLATTYYLIRASATTLKFASSLANAQNGTAIDITGVFGSGTHTLTGTLTARTLAEIGGEETHAMTSTELLAHTHPFQNGNAAASTGAIRSDQAFGAGGLTDSRGGNAAMNVMQCFAVTMAIIKA